MSLSLSMLEEHCHGFCKNNMVLISLYLLNVLLLFTLDKHDTIPLVFNGFVEHDIVVLLKVSIQEVVHLCLLLSCTCTLIV